MKNNTRNKYVKLKDIIEFNPKESIRKGRISKKIAMDKLLPFTKKIIGYELTEFTGGSKFRNGDTLLARITPCLENGKTALVNILDEEEIGFGSTEFIVLRSIKNTTDKDWLFYLSISPSFRDIVIKSMTGTTGRQRAQEDIIKNLEISLPPLAEQKRIAEILSSLDDKIELNERMNKNLEEQAQALFKHWFVDFEFPDDEGKPYKSNGGDLVESELGLIPRGWRVGTLEDICLIKNGFAFKSEEYRENGRKVVRTKNFNNGYVEDNDNVYISVESEEKYSQYLLMKKDFLLVMVGASIGNFVVVTEDVLPALQNQNMWNFRSKNISQEFLNYALLDVVKSNIGQASGSAREFFQKRTFYKIKILIPHNSAVEKFSKIINDNYSIITNIRRETQNLKKLRDTLLPRLMSGEV